MTEPVHRASASAAAIVAVAVLPLVYVPVTVDLDPQKQLVMAVAALLAWRHVTPTAAVCLAVGAVAAVWWPHGAGELLALSAAPALVCALAADSAWRVAGRRVALVVAALAIAQAAGAPIYGGSSAAFGLPYRAVTGPLGNPNFLATYALLWLPLALAPVWTGRIDRRETIEIALTGAALATAAVVSRSVLAWLVLAAQVAVFALAAARRRIHARAADAHAERGWRRGPAAGAVVAAAAGVVAVVAVVGWPAVERAVAGRVYLARVYLSGLSASPWGWLVPRGPRPPGAFLDWQAAFLARHPDHIDQWTFPVFAHNDAVQLVAHYGAVAVVAAVAAVSVVAVRARRSRGQAGPASGSSAPCSPGVTAIAVAIAALGFAAGSTLIGQPAVWTAALAAAVVVLAPRAGSRGPRSEPARRRLWRGLADWCLTPDASPDRAMHPRQLRSRRSKYHEVLGRSRALLAGRLVALARSPLNTSHLALAAGLVWVAAAAANAAADHLRWRAIRAAEAGDYPAALALTDRALSVSRTPAQLYLVRGQVLLGQGRADDAARDLARAADALPHPAVLDALVRARAAAGDAPGVRRAADRMRQIRPVLGHRSGP